MFVSIVVRIPCDVTRISAYCHVFPKRNPRGTVPTTQDAEHKKGQIEEATGKLENLNKQIQACKANAGEMQQTLETLATKRELQVGL